MVWTSGVWTVRPGQEDAFAAAFREFAEWSRRAFGGSRVWLLRQRDRPNVYISLGPWPDDATIAAWRASPGFQERVGAMRALLESFEPRTFDEAVVLE